MLATVSRFNANSESEYAKELKTVTSFFFLGGRASSSDDIQYAPFAPPIIDERAFFKTST